jgi:site-specific DNA recombinase
VHPAGHDPIIDPELFDRVQALLKERGENYPLRAANSTTYLLTSLMRCGRCGHGFVGTAAHGKGGTTYRYYSCFARQRHGTARCDQERIPADALEQAVVQEALAALDDGSIFEEAAQRALAGWRDSHPETERELRAIEKRVEQRRKALDRYLRAFEAGRLSEAMCGYRIREIENELATLEAERGVLEAEQDLAPSAPAASLLSDLRRSVAEAVAAGEAKQVKELLAAVVSRIIVESRASIQPYFDAPSVRTLEPSRRRTGIEPACQLSPAHRF